jgi:Tol biopolymer transport system component
VLRSLLQQADRKLAGEQPLVIYIDDLHQLVTTDLALVASFLTSLSPLLDECPGLHLLFTVNQDKLKRIRHPLLDGAPVYNLGPLPMDASINMVTVPVKDALRFDYGVTKRIAEVNSHHPYYLSLYCYTLLNRQVHDGWVNQQDFDNILMEILDAPIEPFKEIWDYSSWPERAVLTGMAAIQGAHGPITDQEIIRFLQKQDSSVVAEVVMQALQTLVDRGVLIPMGAVSYRFHVELLRFWLRRHTDPAEILAEVDWSRAANQLKPARRARKPLARPAGPASTQRPGRARKRRLWPLLAGLLAAFVCLLLVGGVAAFQILDLPLAALFQPTPTATPTATATSAAGQAAPAQSEAPATPPTPAPTPTPTAPLVVARGLPSIAYMGRDVDEDWRIYVMNADGSEVTPLSPAEGDDTSPVWSPDGRQIAFVSTRDGNREIYLMAVDGQNVVNLTRHPADDWTPAWSPDGSQLAFSSFRAGSWEIYLLDTACFSEPESCPDSLTQFTTNGNGNLAPVWSPDGSRFAFNSKAAGNWDVFTMTASGSDLRQITTAAENDLSPVWSPDGTQLAFESNREGNVEIYVVDAAGGVARNITNFPLADDHGPTWSPDGQQLVFYSNREGNWDIFATTLDGATVVNLTNSPGRDEQTPAWRP